VCVNSGEMRPGFGVGVRVETVKAEALPPHSKVSAARRRRTGPTHRFQDENLFGLGVEFGEV
jgi:hypothetical protein